MNTIDNSPEYYRMREAREREMALDAVSEAIRDIHLAMADKYRKLAEDAEQAPR